MNKSRVFRKWKFGMVVGGVLTMLSAFAIVLIALFVLSNVLDAPVRQGGPAIILGFIISVFGLFAGTFAMRSITRLPPNEGRESSQTLRAASRYCSLILAILCISFIASIFYVESIPREITEYDRNGDGVVDSGSYKRWKMDEQLFVVWIYGSTAVISTVTLVCAFLASISLQSVGIAICFRFCSWLFAAASILAIASTVSLYVDTASFLSYLSPPAAGFLAFIGFITLSIGSFVVSRRVYPS